MASGDIFTQQQPKDLTPQNGIFNEVPLVYPVSAGGGVAGVPLNKLATQGYQFQCRVWNNGTPLTTGLTVQLALVDDPANSAPPRRAGRGDDQAAGRLGDYTQTGASTEVTANVTMPATPGQLVTQTIAVAKAAISASLAAGDNVLVQIRRIGTAAADTHQGRVLLTGATVQDT